MAISLTFKGWQRQGAASTITTAATGERVSTAIAVEMQITRGATESTKPLEPVMLELRGPGDVLDVSKKAIRRVWPPPGDQDVEENLFPLLELNAADLPWRYTPEPPVEVPDTTATRLPPWLCLLALREDWVGREGEAPEVESLPSTDPRRLPPRVRIRAGTPLPNLKYAWSWAHVEEMVGDEDGGIARLLCPRRLAPLTRYRVVLVPTYLSGKRAGLGESPGGSGLSPAWRIEGNGAHGVLGEDLLLPVYHGWRFRTAPPGDVESLARKLRLASTLPPGVGRMSLSVDLGWPQGPEMLELETALGEDPAPSVRAPTPALQTQIVQALGLNDLPHDPATGDPLIRMPLYGEQHVATGRRIGRVAGAAGANGTTVNPADGGWFSQLNADPRWRVVAGLGAEVVRRHQETFMEEAWRWLADHRAEVAAAQLRAEVQYTWRQRAVVPVVAKAIASAAPNPWLLGRIAPLVRTSLLKTGGKSGHPLAETQLRRTLRPAARLGKVLLENRAAGAFPLALLAKHLENAVQRPPHRARLTAVPLSGRAELTPRGLEAGAMVRRLGSTSQIEREVLPSFPAPRIERPIAPLLAEVARDWLLAGAAALEEHRVYLLRQNPSFIEAFFAGMNHEIGREFLWREFPTDGRATIFAHFWESLEDTLTPTPAVQDMIRWARLGANTAGNPPLVLLLKTPLLRRYPDLALFLARYVTDAQGRKVLHRDSPVRPIFHGRLDRDVSFFGFPKPWAGTNPPEQQDWSFVLQEQLQAPRFGLDLSGSNDRVDNPTSPDALDWDHFGQPAWLAPTPENAERLGILADGTLGGTVTSASFARATFQQPIQISIPARLLLAP